MTDFETSNKKVHPVETQWHYPVMVSFGFEPVTKEAVGFVRTYEYFHPAGHHIKVSTGVNSDYWTNLKNKEMGYWSELESYLVKIMK